MLSFLHANEHVTNDLIASRDHAAMAMSVAVFRGCERVITRSADNIAEICVVGAGPKLKTLAGHADMVMSVAVFADDESVMTGAQRTPRRSKQWAQAKSRRCSQATQYGDVGGSVRRGRAHDHWERQ